MDPIIHPLYKMSVQNLLKDFQAKAVSSLRGPSGFSLRDLDFHRNDVNNLILHDIKKKKMAVKENPSETKDKESWPAKFTLPLPIFMERDTGCTELSKTDFGGHTIYCFEIGGEKRLCLPQLFKFVFRQFSQQDIQAATEELNLHIASCSTNQLFLLKESDILPSYVQSCGLLTKTDTERLSNKLLPGGSTDYNATRFSTDSFKVYHECLGECSGVFDPNLYWDENTPCVRCSECQRLFSPSNFVGHSHSTKDDRINHWGFEKQNWRSYLLVARDQEPLQEIKKALEEMKNRFKKSHRKRKQVTDGEQVLQKIHGDLLSSSTNALTDRDSLPVELNQSPPAVLNPEKIVPFTGHERYDRDFVPNISLVPCDVKKRVDYGHSSSPLLCDRSADQLLDVESLSTDSDSEDDEYTPSRKHTTSDDLPEVRQIIHESRRQELGLVQDALSGSVLDREAFIQRYLQSRSPEQKVLHDLIVGQQDMHKEIKDLDLRKEDLQRELSQTRRKAERDRLDSKLQSQEALHENRRLKQEMEEVKRIHARDIEQLKDKHVTEIDQLTSRFNQSLHVNAQLSRDACHLSEIVRKAGVDVDVSSVRAAYTSSASGIVAQHLRHHVALQPINITPIKSSAVL